mgnify:CR=1 FL=1
MWGALDHDDFLLEGNMPRTSMSLDGRTRTFVMEARFNVDDADVCVGPFVREHGISTYSSPLSVMGFLGEER